MQNFKNFLESLKNESNSHEVDTLMEAYTALFEFPHADTVTGEVVDLHVEDVLKKYGKETAMEYITLILHNLNNDMPIDVLFADGGQLSHLEHPKELLKPDRMNDLVNRLTLIKNNLSK